MRNRICGESEERVNHIISQNSKRALKEYKTRNDWVGKMIQKELCKRLKVDHTTKRYMEKPVSTRKNQTYKDLLDFDKQTDHQILTRKPKLELFNNKKSIYNLLDFTDTKDHSENKKKSETTHKH